MEVPARLTKIHSQEWLNTNRVTPGIGNGKITLLGVFQMLCPGCVYHGIPQLQRFYNAFQGSQVQVIGLHSVFEHHPIMGPEALAVFVNENRYSFPIAIDEPTDFGIPRTMADLCLKGTPSNLILDEQGYIREHRFGRLEDAEIAAMLFKLSASSCETKCEIGGVS